MKIKTKPIHVLTVGSFGEQTAAMLREMVPQVVITRVTGRNSTTPSTWPDARMHMVAAWRIVPDLLELVNEMSFGWRTAFVPAVIEEAELVIGPVIIPGLSACYTCYERRVLQHCTRPDAREALKRHYETVEDSGPKGHLKVFADLAAARLAQVAYEVETQPHQIAGAVWQFDLMRRMSTLSTVVGIHGCHHCGLHREERTRSYSLLLAELAPLLQTGAKQELTGAMAHLTNAFAGKSI